MKEDIIKKALELFLTYGFKSVTMDDLAREMGISKKTIYTHFKNKTDLVQDTAIFVFEEVSRGIDMIRSLNKNPIEELYEIKKFVMHYLKHERAAPQFQLQKYYPKVHRTLMERQYDVMQKCVVENMKKGLAMGIFRENLNVDFVARIYFAGGTSIKNQELFPPEMFPTTQLMDEFLEYHLRGIVTPKGRKILNEIINSNHE